MNNNNNKFNSSTTFGDFGTVIITDVVICFIILLVWQFLRTRVSLRAWYTPKLNEPTSQAENLPSNSGIFGWIRGPMSITDERVFELRGLDALMHIYFLRTMLFMFLTVLPFAIVLIAVNGTGDQGVKGVAQLSVSNVARDSHRLWAVVACGYFITAAVLFWLYRGYMLFEKFSILENLKNIAHNHSILVRDLVDYNPANDSNVVATHYAVKGVNKLRKLQTKRRELVQEGEFLRLQQQETGEVPLKKSGLLRKNVDAIQANERKVQKVDNKIAALNSPLNNNANACLVTYSTSAFAYDACRVGYTNSGSILKPVPAPYVNDVMYESLGTTNSRRAMGTLIAVVAIFFLIFFWAIPVFFASALANLNSLSKVSGLHFLSNTSHWGAIPRGLIQGFLPPLVLIAFFSLIPLILRKLNTLRAPESYSRLDRLVTASYYAFDVVNVFLVTAIASGIFNILSTLESHLSGSAIANLLGNMIPAQSNLFINLILAYALITYPVRLLRLNELIPRMMKIGKAKTEVHRQFINRALPRLYSLSYAIELLVFTIAITYSFIAPFVVPFAILFFAVAYLVGKHDAVYISIPKNLGRGKHFHTAFSCAIGGLLLAHVIVFAVLALMGFPYVAILAPVPIATIIFAIYAKKRFHPTCDLVSEASYAESGKQGVNYLDAYLDPVIDPRRQLTPLREDIHLSNLLEVGLVEIPYSANVIPMASGPAQV